MSGTIKANVQMGDSVTPANNFVITAEANDGTMKLARGNKGATTQDVMTVNAAGAVEVPLGFAGFTVLLAQTGYIRCPSWFMSGLVFQWGLTAPATSVAITFPLQFPNAAYAFNFTPVGGAANIGKSMGALSAVGTTIYTYTANSAAGVAVSSYWFAIGR